jgi:hypothetical protein
MTPHLTEARCQENLNVKKRDPPKIPRLEENLTLDLLFRNPRGFPEKDGKKQQTYC